MAVIDSLTGNLLNPIKTLNSINGVKTKIYLFITNLLNFKVFLKKKQKEIVSVMQSPKLSTLLIISKNNDNKVFLFISKFKIILKQLTFLK